MEAAEAHKAEGNKALQAKDFEAAVAAYTKALEESEGLAEAPRHVYYSNRSAAHLSKGDAAAALADGEACIEANKEWPKGYSRKGAALHALRRYEDAAQAFEAGLALAPGDAALQSGLEDVKKAQAQAQAARAQANPLAGIFAPENLVRIAGHPVYSKYLADADFMAKVQTLQTDPTAFQTVLLQDKRVMDVFGFLTGIDMRAGPMGEGDEEEEQQAQRASAPAPAPAPEPAEEELTEEEREKRKRKREAVEHKEVRVEACVCLLVVGGIESHARTHAHTHPKHAQRGNKHYAKKEFAEALAAYDAAIALDEGNMTFLTNKVCAWVTGVGSVGALVPWTCAAVADPSPPLLPPAWQAAVFIEQGKYDEAIAQCEEAVAVGRAHRAAYEDVAKAFVRLGKACLKKDDLAAALTAFRQAQVEHFSRDVERQIKQTELEKRKRDAAAYVDPAKGAEAKDRGNEHFRAGKWPEAIKEYEEAIKRDPGNAAYHNNRAAALAKLMDFTAAKAACEKAIELDPKYVKAWAKKGDIEFFMKASGCVGWIGLVDLVTDWTRGLILHHSTHSTQQEYHRAMESYKTGLALEPNNSLCVQGLQKTVQKIREASSQEVDMERAAHGMADPEVQAILSVSTRYGCQWSACGLLPLWV